MRIIKSLVSYESVSQKYCIFLPNRILSLESNLVATCARDDLITTATLISPYLKDAVHGNSYTHAACRGGMFLIL